MHFRVVALLPAPVYAGLTRPVQACQCGGGYAEQIGLADEVSIGRVDYVAVPAAGPLGGGPLAVLHRPARWGAYEGKRILDPATAAEMTCSMTRFQSTDANRPQNFPAEDGNAGLFWRTKFNGTRVGHGGTTRV